jgi:mRNA interferase HigB
VRVLNTKLIEAYLADHARCRGSLKAWLAEARAALWSTPSDIKSRFPSASILSENRVVFDIAGNRYRLLCRIAYRSAVVFVLRIGTHAEYDKWDL